MSWWIDTGRGFRLVGHSESVQTVCGRMAWQMVVGRNGRVFGRRIAFAVAVGVNSTPLHRQLRQQKINIPNSLTGAIKETRKVTSLPATSFPALRCIEPLRNGQQWPAESSVWESVQQIEEKEKTVTYIFLHGWFLSVVWVLFSSNREIQGSGRNDGWMRSIPLNMHHTHTHMCVNHMFVGQPVGKKSIDRDSPGVLEAKPEVAEMGITPSHAPMATRAETSAKSRQTSCNQQTNGEIFSGHLERKIDNLSTRQN